jgi:CRP/FNR family cyclic AMP-dependent transcriptional regulator
MNEEEDLQMSTKEIFHHNQEEDSVLDEKRKAVLFGDAAESGKWRLEFDANHEIFRQGEPAESVFYLGQGMVELSVKSPEGKEAIFATLGSGEFFGEECLAGQRERIATATTVTQCALTRIEKKLMTRMLHEQHEVQESFITYLLSRYIRYEADLVDQLFNSSEKRLARALLLLSHFGKESRTATIVPGINQENLAQMVGTTRSRVSHFLNNFRKLGYIDYGSGGLTVKSGLRSVVGHDQFLEQLSQGPVGIQSGRREAA